MKMETTKAKPQDKVLRGLLRRRPCLVPTWRGWLVVLLALVMLSMVALKGVQPFLAVNAPRPNGVLVIEGWAPDVAMEAAARELRESNQEKIYVTGGPIEQGGPLAEYKTFAELGSAVLIKLGVSSNAVQAVPAPSVPQDRTYTSAVALRQWWEAHGLGPTNVNLITVGAHARRSRLMFEKALGEKVTVGVWALPVNDYDPEHWWRSSQGFRVVMGEALAYGYARVFFHSEQ
jgi:uncharacterized SAM-binding protein YcdF (DUF218 family)